MKYLLLYIVFLVGCSDYVTRDELRDAYDCLMAKYEVEQQYVPICSMEPTPPPESLCTNTCGPEGASGLWVGDGECDDGGLNSLYSICPLGTDCIDCGPRTPEPTNELQISQEQIDSACRFIVDYYERCPGIR